MGCCRISPGFLEGASWAFESLGHTDLLPLRKEQALLGFHQFSQLLNELYTYDG